MLLSLFSGKGRFFRFRFPALPLLGISKQSLPQEDPDAVMVDSPHHSDGSVATHDYQLPTTRESCSPSYANDTRALIAPTHYSAPISGPLDHSSPKSPWDRIYPDEAVAQTQHQSQEDTLNAAPSIPGLTPTASRESVCSIRRASSVHDMEGFGSNSKMVFRDRHASEGRIHSNCSISYTFTCTCCLTKCLYCYSFLSFTKKWPDLWGWKCYGFSKAHLYCTTVKINMFLLRQCNTIYYNIYVFIYFLTFGKLSC